MSFITEPSKSSYDSLIFCRKHSNFWNQSTAMYTISNSQYISHSDYRWIFVPFLGKNINQKTSTWYYEYTENQDYRKTKFNRQYYQSKPKIKYFILFARVLLVMFIYCNAKEPQSSQPVLSLVHKPMVSSWCLC